MLKRNAVVEEAPKELDAPHLPSDSVAARALFEGLASLGDGVAIFDRDGIALVCSDAYRAAYPDIADLLEPGAEIRDILIGDATRRGHSRRGQSVSAWVDAELRAHFTDHGVSEQKLGNDRWYRVTQRQTKDGHVIKFLVDIHGQKTRNAGTLLNGGRIGEAIESLDEGVALFDAEDRLVMSNSRYSEIFKSVADIVRPGVQFEALIRTAAARKQNFDAIMTPEDWIQRRLEAHRQASGNFEHRFTNGQWILVRERRTADGGIIGTYTDITALKQREATLHRTLGELEAAHVRIKNVIESSFDWNWTSSIDGTVVCEMRPDPAIDDFDPAPFIALTLAALPSDSTATSSSAADSAGTVNLQPPAPFRNLIHNGTLPDGREIYLRISGNPVYDRTGQFCGYCGAASDVTETVSAQREAAQRAAMLHATIESAAQGMVVFDRDLVVQIASQRALAMLSLKELPAGETLRLDQIIESAIVDQIAAWRESRRDFEMPPIERREASGAVTVIRANSMPDGGLVLTLTDVTEQVHTEERQHQAQKMVALGHLVGGVAHEFNNLLTSICGFSKMALDKVHQVDLVRDCLEEVVLASDRAADLTKRMLAFGRKQPLDPKIFPASKIIIELERMLRSLLPESIELSFSLSEEEAYVRSDATQMSQALLNLALNARDAMPMGGKLTLGLTIGSMPSSDDSADTDLAYRRAAIYQVIDTGTGIDEATLPQIFDPFFTTKEQGKGTGLGLSFVHGLVERSGGRIQVESNLGVGTIFEVILPLVEPEESARDDEEAPITERNCKETILVVEDEAGVRGFVRAVLADCGYEVLTAASCDEALGMFEAFRTPPHLLLTDVVLPGRSGQEIAQEILRRSPETKVIFMTGYADRDGPLLSQIGPEHLRLDKPFSPAVLANAIRAVLDGAAIVGSAIDSPSVQEGRDGHD